MVRGVDARASVGRTLLSAGLDLGVGFDLLVPTKGKSKVKNNVKGGGQECPPYLENEHFACSCVTDSGPGSGLQSIMADSSILKPES